MMLFQKYSKIRFTEKMYIMQLKATQHKILVDPPSIRGLSQCSYLWFSFSRTGAAGVTASYVLKRALLLFPTLKVLSQLTC